MDALIVQAQDAQSCLEMDPKTTHNYVNYLSFLEDAPKMVRNRVFMSYITFKILPSGM